MSEAIAGGSVATLERRRMSWEDYLALPEYPRAEWVDGEVVMTPLGSVKHQWVSRRLAKHLERHLPDLFVFDAINLKLPHNRLRIPDGAAFESMPTGLAAEVVPVLVVEVLSPSTRGEDLMRKAPEYASAGIAQYWVVDLEDSSIEVSTNVDGRWEVSVRIDRRTPTGEVVVGEHGTVPLDLDDLLDG